MENLTKKQDRVLKYVKKFMVSHGYPQTVREICKNKDSNYITSMLDCIVALDLLSI